MAAAGRRGAGTLVSAVGKRFGVATTAASVGALSGTFTMEIESCGGWQSGKVSDGKYDDT